jgi:hypothetical protein
MILYHYHCSKRKQLSIVSNWVYYKFIHFNLEMFPDVLFIIVKLQITWPLNSIFIKKSVLVSNIIIKIPKTFRLWFQCLILIEINIFSHSKSSVHRPIFICVISFSCRVVWQAVWHRLRQIKLKSAPKIIIPASKNICLIKE